MDKIKVYSSNLYVPTRRLHPVSLWEILRHCLPVVYMLSCVIERRRYCQDRPVDRSVALGEDSLQSLLSYVFSSNEYSLYCWPPENGHSPVHSCLVLCPATLCTGLQLVLIISEQIQCPFDVRLVEHVQWIPQGRLPYGDLVPENKNTGTRIGKTMYPLSLRSRTTTKKIQLFLLL